LIHYYSEFGRKLEKATEGSFGYDLVATEDGQIPGGKRGIFGTGIYLDASRGVGIPLVLSRSGLAAKGIIVANAPGLIDADYRGEVRVILHNLNQQSHYVSAGDRIAQLLIVSGIGSDPLMYTSPDTFSDTKRGAGGFGSTGNN